MSGYSSKSDATDRSSLPAQLRPWAGLLGGTWPPKAGPIPDQQEVDMALRWVKPGEVSGLAIAMYCRLGGASNAEVLAACRDKKTNRARALHLARKLDFVKAWMNDGTLRYFIGPAGSRPGPPAAEPFVTEASAPDGGETMTEIPEQLVSIANRLRCGDTTRRHTVRSILKWFGVTRRGLKLIADIKTALAALDLETQPDIDDADIDELVQFILAAPAKTSASDNGLSYKEKCRIRC
jgi:hypothetical protein